MVEKSKSKESEQKKECFVIMPISNPDGYPNGHFDEVYSELIRPAVTDAGFTCIRAHEVVSSNLIHLDVVTKVVNADLCVCDLSSRNPNVLFEYGIRQAFDKPTVLIKDDITERIFDVSSFRDIEYDHTLRIKNILATRKSIKDAIDATVMGASDEGQVFSLVKLMGLAQAAKIPSESIDQETAQFQIINKQLRNLQDMMMQQHVRFRNIDLSGHGRPSSKPILIDLLNDRSAKITLPDGRIKIITDLPSLRESEIIAHLSSKQINQLEEHLMPF